jgi:AmiR/NasT family two-component response regulator
VDSVSENPEHQHLRVLIANQRSDRLDYVTKVVVSLGHEVVARSIEVGEVAAVTKRELPDVALVGLGESSKHALELIGLIVRQAACPVIALLETDDHTFVSEAAKRGVFAYITDTSSDQLQDSIEIVLRRFAEFQSLEGAFGRRAAIERAKGILMERHDTSEEQAFEMLRSSARNGNRKLVDIAIAVVDGRRLLPGPPKAGT